MAEYNEKGIGDETPHFEQMLKVAIDAELRHTWTAIPGIVKSFDSDKQTAEINVALKQGYYTQENEIKYRDHPLLLSVPVYFVGGLGFCVTHKLEPGDSGIIIFSARCLDSWLRSGGVQEPDNIRKHSFSDGMFIPGLRANTNKIENFQTDGIEIRNQNRDVFLKITSDGIFFPGTIDPNIKLETHVHDDPQGGITGPPKNPPI